ncbi:nuclear transport factor 2 family protein [Streptomyces sp. NPDC002795]|uniref:nuclear transport factor 2 family protein n=1 Tax=Streptomyces sp. NPDC002795 TaxID=3364665 RepID=UPI00369448D5
MTDAEKIFRAYNDAENAHAPDTAAQLLAPDLDVQVNGRQALASAEDDRAANDELLRRYPDYRREIVDVVANGERAVARWRMRGTPSAADGEPLDVHGCSVVTVRDGRITQAFLYYDGGALAAVLDAVTGPDAD